MAASSSQSSAASAPHGEFEMMERKAPQIEISEAHEKRSLNEVMDDGDQPQDATNSTQLDQFQMERMGKKQVLVRRFKPISTFAFNAMCTSVWEFGIFSVNQGLVDGGRAGLIWMTIIHAIGFIPVVLSMAEMASIAPTAGGQYHWVSEFAHPRYQKVLSYYTGWISTLAWQAGNAIGVFLTGTLIQVIMLENDPMYMFPAWHGALFVMACIVFSVAGNIYLGRYIPRVQTLFFVLHILAFFCVIIPICINAPKATAKQVFTEFENTGGWSNLPYAVLVGQLSAIYMMAGTDSAAHISEEVRSAAKFVPRSMMGVFACNMVITLATWFVLCFAMPDVSKALADPSLYPAVYILKQSMSIGWVTVVLTMIIALVLFANVCYLTAVSRDLFAFARDGGTPFPNWISTVSAKHQAPVNAVFVTGGFSFALSLIYIGSPTAFYAITSLMTVALMQCYMVSIASMLWRRIKMPETIPESPFSLGKWGIPLNAWSVVWTAWSFFWSFWPQYSDVTPGDFNWASVIFVAVLVFAGVWYFIKGHKTYHGPVVLVKRM